MVGRGVAAAAVARGGFGRVQGRGGGGGGGAAVVVAAVLVLVGVRLAVAAGGAAGVAAGGGVGGPAPSRATAAGFGGEVWEGRAWRGGCEGRFGAALEFAAVRD